jgi:hypothetical protein
LVAGYAAPPEPQRPTPPPERHLDVDHPGQLSSWTAFASAGSQGPRAPSGNTPPSTSPRPMPGPPSRSPGATPRPPGPASSPARSRPTWLPAAGTSSGS